MNRYISAATPLALVALISLSCASKSGPSDADPATRHIPDPAGLEEWLGGPSRDGNLPPEFFIQMADPQLGFTESPIWMALFGATWNDDRFEVDARKFETAIDHANELEPAFVVICGDLVNRVGHPGQIGEFLRIAGKLNRSIPLYFVAGNHDVENRPTADSLLAYRETFGDDWYSFRHADVYGIVLNSQLIDAPEHVHEEAERQRSWLIGELDRGKSSGARHLIIFQHHPYFLSSPDEEKQYFNIARETRDYYLDLFASAGVDAVFAGHYHRNSVARDGPLEMVTTGPVGRPLGSDPSGFRIVNIRGDALVHEYFSLEGR
jgi:DNA repair exonuclease SbcCD nuclease subunit